MNRFPVALAGVLAVVVPVALLTVLGPAHAALFAGDKSEAKEAPKKPAPTIKETLSAVGEISRELRSIDEIEKRLATIEKHVAGIDESLVPVGNALKPEGLRQIADLVIDTAYERAKNILLLVTAFGAVLIAFGAVALRWAFAGRRAHPATSVKPQESA